MVRLFSAPLQRGDPHGLLRTGRTVDIYFCFLLLSFCSRRRVYHRRVTFFFLRGWIVHSRFPFFTSGEQDQANEQIDISFHTSESNLRSDFAALTGISSSYSRVCPSRLPLRTAIHSPLSVGFIDVSLVYPSDL